MEAPVKQRVFLAGLFHETNTFVEKATPLEAFQVLRGEELFATRGDDSPMDGFLETATLLGWEVVPGISYRAMPSGPVADAVFEAYWNELLPLLSAALQNGLDAIFLILHGAMATEHHRDVEGELLARVRSLEGAASLPLVAVLDLHANVSERMAKNASALIPYRKNPHTDARETAVRASYNLQKALLEGAPRTYVSHSGILLAPPSTGTDDSPIAPLEQLARTLETETGHWEVGIIPGFAHSDTRDTGLTFCVTSDRDEASCRQTLATLTAKARTLAQQIRNEEWDLADALDRIAVERKFPALIVEPADNIGGGASGDATFVLRALLERPLGHCGVAICDPEAVASLQGHTPGSSAHISLGGKGSSLDPGPVDLEVRLERLTDGCFDLEDKQSHLASVAGSSIKMGPCAVVTHRHLTILVTSEPVAPFDLGQWRSQGIAPEELDIMDIKAAVGHRRAYSPIARSSYTVKTPGPCTSDLISLPYRLIRRPIFPLDSMSRQTSSEKGDDA